jgi:hypothetical protein
MPKKQYHVRLSAAERAELKQLLASGTASARKLTHARLLLKAAAGCTDDALGDVLDVGRAPVERLRQRFVTGGVGDALHRRPPQRR